MAYQERVRLSGLLQHRKQTGNRIAVLVIFVKDLFQHRHRKAAAGGQALHIAGAVGETAILAKPGVRGGGNIRAFAWEEGEDKQSLAAQTGGGGLEYG